MNSAATWLVGALISVFFLGIGAYYLVQVITAFRSGRIKASRGPRVLDRGEHPIAFYITLIYYILIVIFMLGAPVSVLIGAALNN